MLAASLVGVHVVELGGEVLETRASLRLDLALAVGDEGGRHDQHGDDSGQHDVRQQEIVPADCGTDDGVITPTTNVHLLILYYFVFAPLHCVYS